MISMTSHYHSQTRSKYSTLYKYICRRFMRVTPRLAIVPKSMFQNKWCRSALSWGMRVNWSTYYALWEGGLNCGSLLNANVHNGHNRHKFNSARFLGLKKQKQQTCQEDKSMALCEKLLTNEQKCRKIILRYTRLSVSSFMLIRVPPFRLNLNTLPVKLVVIFWENCWLNL